MAFEQAIRQAWDRQLGLLAMMELCNAWSAVGQNGLAAVLYQTWLKRNRTSHDHLAWFNYGVLLFSLGDHAGALEAYARALQLAPDFLQPRFNLGLTYERLGNSTAAVAQWQHMVGLAREDDAQQRPLLLMALNNLGRHLEDQNRYADALAALTRSLQLEPDQPDTIHHWVFLRAKQCVWPVYQPLALLDVAAQKRHTSAMAMIGLSDDPAEQLEAAYRFVDKKVNVRVPSLAPTQPYGHRRLRVAYCSSDFCNHPVSMLTVELFELHDRDRFEVYGFDWSRDDGSPLRQRVVQAMDHFESIHALSDEAAARRIRECEIDVLIDLQGQTLGARPNMLAYRPAPVQVTYLGLPATTGLPFIDHVIADRYLIPEHLAHHYSEKPVYLPTVYQVSDRQRTAADRTPTRAECGLPAEGVVFCSFNNNYKITPDMFRCWLRILRQVPGSVLWLLADNEWARDNLCQEALAAGVEPARLVFAPRARYDEYLARYRVADLFLDTFPFNGGTTANDVLWMGLPLVTLSGETFASRMAGALLTAAGLPQLITTDLETYERVAVNLAHNTVQRQALREHLCTEREAQRGLFDVPCIVAELEAALQALTLPPTNT
jgi:predicted O-linked N-acetylglucosamine transferase (SPINDLY family)